MSPCPGRATYHAAAQHGAELELLQVGAGAAGGAPLPVELVAADDRILLTAIDGQVNGGGGVDRFRLKIWDRSTGTVVYDNRVGAAEDNDAATALGGGSIVVHK